MPTKLKLKDASGNVTFDSSLAVGGVPLGFYTVPAEGGTFSTTDFPNRSGVALTLDAGICPSYTVDNPPGTLRFTFPYGCAGTKFLLFAL